MVKNEEQQIAECIESIKEFVDEIIIADNGSVDHTKKVVEKLGCIVIDVLEGDESERRNEYLKIANGDWILLIDADERATKEFGVALREEIFKASENILGFRVPRFDYHGQGGWSSIITCKVIKNHKNICYSGGDIHPTLAPSIFAQKGNLGLIKAPIHHLDALIKNRTPQKRKMYIEKIEKFIEENKNKPTAYRLLNYLGTEYTAAGLYDLAEKCYMETSRNDVQSLPLSLLYLAQNSLMQGNLDVAESFVRKLLSINKEDILKQLPFEITQEIIDDLTIIADDLIQRGLIILAEIQVRKDNLQAALTYCEEALKLWPFGSHHYINIASILKMLNDEKYLSYIEKAILTNPYLNDERVFSTGYTPNIYQHQTSILSCANNVIEDLKKEESLIV